jgi:chromosome partitioning protein
MRKWAFVCQKGGTGKSSLATQLAVYATQCGENVVIVDLDPQETCADWYRLRSHHNDGVALPPSVLPALSEKLLDVVKAAPAVGYTLMLIDTPPASDKHALAAIEAADRIIVPTRCSVFDIQALRDSLALIDMCKKRSVTIGVVNCVPPGKAAADIYDTAADALISIGLKVCVSYIGHRQPIVHATDIGKGITETAPKDKGAEEIRKLWDELNLLDPLTKPAKPAKSGKAKKDAAR